MIDVYSRAQWGAVAPKSVTRMATPAPRLWLHHSADDRTGPTAVRDHQRFHMGTRGWQDIAYSWLGDPDRLYVGRGEGVVGGHTAGDNSKSHAVCMLGNFDARHPTDLELSTAAWGAVHAWRQGAIATPAYTGGHRDAPGASTACPGRFLYQAIPEINRRAAMFAAAEETTVAAPVLVKKTGTDDIWQIVGRTRSHMSAAAFALIVDEQGRKVDTAVKLKWVHELPGTHEVWKYPVLEQQGNTDVANLTAAVAELRTAYNAHGHGKTNKPDS